MPVINLDVPQIDGTFLPDGEYSDAVDVQRLEPWKSFHFYIEDSAELQIQATNDGSHWVAIGSNITSSGITNIVEPFAFVRIAVVANASGDTSCYLSARGPGGS